MPEPKHRRKGKRRPRPRKAQGPPVKPEPSPPWVPATGAALLGLGVAVIVVGYIPAVARLTRGLPALGSNWSLIAGFVFLVGGFGFLTQWR